jgi:hypothetical protein
MSVYQYETICPNCGKVVPEEVDGNRKGKFCNRNCYLEFNKRKREAAKRKDALTPAKTPEEQCERCQYGSLIGGMWGCSYFEITDHARLPLHPGGLPDECQEFERRKRGRRPKPNHILLK